MHPREDKTTKDSYRNISQNFVIKKVSPAIITFLDLFFKRSIYIATLLAKKREAPRPPFKKNNYTECMFTYTACNSE